MCKQLCQHVSLSFVKRKQSRMLCVNSSGADTGSRLKYPGSWPTEPRCSNVSQHDSNLSRAGTWPKRQRLDFVYGPALRTQFPVPHLHKAHHDTGDLPSHQSTWNLTGGDFERKTVQTSTTKRTSNRSMFIGGRLQVVTAVDLVDVGRGGKN